MLRIGHVSSCRAASALMRRTSMSGRFFLRVLAREATLSRRPSAASSKNVTSRTSTLPTSDSLARISEVTPLLLERGAEFARGRGEAALDRIPVTPEAGAQIVRRGALWWRRPRSPGYYRRTNAWLGEARRLRSIV